MIGDWRLGQYSISNLQSPISLLFDDHREVDGVVRGDDVEGDGGGGCAATSGDGFVLQGGGLAGSEGGDVGLETVVLGGDCAVGYAGGIGA